MSGFLPGVLGTNKLKIIQYFRANDIDKATKAKFEVEQKQRDEAKVRKDTNADWDNRVSAPEFCYSNDFSNSVSLLNFQYFKPAGEAWIYKSPLNHRLTLSEQQR